MSGGVAELDEPKRESELGGEGCHRAGVESSLQRVDQAVDEPDDQTDGRRAAAVAVAANEVAKERTNEDQLRA